MYRVYGDMLSGNCYKIKMMKAALLLLILSASYPALSSEKVLGEFSTIIEVGCHSEIHFLESGKGIYMDTCHKDRTPNSKPIEKQNISWQMNKNKILAKINGINEIFTYHNKLPCADFGKTGSSDGFIGMDLYFWRKPVTCK